MKVSKSKRQVPVEPEYETVYHLTLTDHEAQALRKVCALVSGPPSGTRGIFDQIATESVAERGQNESSKERTPNTASRYL